MPNGNSRRLYSNRSRWSDLRQAESPLQVNRNFGKLGEGGLEVFNDVGAMMLGAFLISAFRLSAFEFSVDSED